MPKILQLTKYGNLAASTRQRFNQYLPYLKDEDLQIESISLLDDNYLNSIYNGSGTNNILIAKKYIRRFRYLVGVKGVDLIWVHCEVFPYLPGWFELLVKISGSKVVYDYDDAIFHNYDLHRNAIVRFILGKKLVPLLSVADAAFCGNKYLFDYAHKYCAGATIVPTVLDADVYVPAAYLADQNQARIGWIGSPTTWAAYMAPMMPLLVDVAGRHGSRVLAVGAGRSVPTHALLDNVPWTEKEEVSLIQQMDIGVMPLTDTPWARGKCGYKLIQYMSCGLPVVASPVGVNAELVEHGVNGFLATTESEWREALDRLLGDRDLRRRMGAEGRRKVVRDYSLQVWGPRVARILREVASGARMA